MQFSRAAQFAQSACTKFNQSRLDGCNHFRLVDPTLPHNLDSVLLLAIKADRKERDPLSRFLCCLKCKRVDSVALLCKISILAFFSIQDFVLWSCQIWSCSVKNGRAPFGIAEIVSCIGKTVCQKHSLLRAHSERSSVLFVMMMRDVVMGVWGHIQCHHHPKANPSFLTTERRGLITVPMRRLPSGKTQKWNTEKDAS